MLQDGQFMECRGAIRSPRRRPARHPFPEFAMLIPFLLGLTLSAGQPVPAYLPWPAEAGPPPNGTLRSITQSADAFALVGAPDDDIPF